MKLPKDNLCYPVQIEIDQYSGSGFFIRNDIDVYLVTAKHVLFKEDTNSLFSNEMKIRCYSNLNGEVSETPYIFQLDLGGLLKTGNLRTGKKSDIVLIKFGSANENKISLVSEIKEIEKSCGIFVLYDFAKSRKFKDVEVTNEVFVLGYPTSLTGIEHNTPLARRGIIAGKNNKEKTLILDCPVYGGNSGGLVLEVNNEVTNGANIHLVGIVVRFVPFIDQWQNSRFPTLINSSFQNSGYSIALSVDYIYDLISEIETVTDISNIS